MLCVSNNLINCLSCHVILQDWKSGRQEFLCISEYALLSTKYSWINLLKAFNKRMQDKCFISGYSYESTMDYTTQYTAIEIGEFVVHT